MGVTLAGFALVRILVEALARRSYMSPVAASVPIQGTEQFNPASGAWVYSQGVVNATGRMVLSNGSINCGGAAAAAAKHGVLPPCGNDLVQQGLGPAPFSNWMQYQPGSRFWDFQGIESGIFLGIAAILIYLAVRRIRSIS
jgi:hypothetical protein